MSEATYTAEFESEAVEIPKLAGAGRPSAPNPLMTAVEAANKDRDHASRFTVAYGTPAAGDKRDKEIKRDLSRAGTKLGVIVRRNVVNNVTAKTITVTFWVVDKVAKPATETAEPTEDKPKGK